MLTCTKLYINQTSRFVTSKHVIQNKFLFAKPTQRSCSTTPPKEQIKEYNVSDGQKTEIEKKDIVNVFKTSLKPFLDGTKTLFGMIKESGVIMSKDKKIPLTYRERMTRKFEIYQFPLLIRYSV